MDRYIIGVSGFGMSESVSVSEVDAVLSDAGVSGAGHPLEVEVDWQREIFEACFGNQRDPHDIEAVEDRMCCDGMDCKHQAPDGSIPAEHHHHADTGEPAAETDLETRLQAAFDTWLAEPGVAAAPSATEPVLKKMRLGNLMHKARSKQWRYAAT